MGWMDAHTERLFRETLGQMVFSLVFIPKQMQNAFAKYCFIMHMIQTYAFLYLFHVCGFPFPVETLNY